MTRDSSHKPRGKPELPVNVTAQGLEVQPRRTGRAHVDLVIAGCAIFISLLSLAIAFNQTRMMRQQVAASSWPLLQYTTSNTDQASKKLVIKMTVQNAGVGPAIVKSFTMNYAGRSYTNPYDLLRDCCGYRVTHPNSTLRVDDSPLTGTIAGSVIRPGDEDVFLLMPLSEQNAAAWRRLDAVRFKLRFDTCYCSVLGECWRSDLTSIEPRSVRACPMQATGP